MWNSEIHSNVWEKTCLRQPQLHVDYLGQQQSKCQPLRRMARLNNLQVQYSPIFFQKRFFSPACPPSWLHRGRWVPPQLWCQSWPLSPPSLLSSGPWTCCWRKDVYKKLAFIELDTVEWMVWYCNLQKPSSWWLNGWTCCWQGEVFKHLHLWKEMRGRTEWVQTWCRNGSRVRWLEAELFPPGDLPSGGDVDKKNFPKNLD